MNLPNKLTLSRIILTPLFVVAILWSFPFHYLVALMIFSIASFTDMLDGKIARNRNLVTNFGKFLDPLADKILVLSALMCFVQNDICSCIIVIITLFREFTVSSIRLVAAADGKVVAANMWGKVKTVTQMISIILIFVLQFVLELMEMGIIPIGAEGIEISSWIFYCIGEIALWISTLFCIISGIIYIRDNKDVISEK